jgi:large subunit ribosomal protein L4
VSQRKHLLVVVERDDVLTWKSVQNVPAVHVIAPGQLNTYDVLVADDVVFTTSSLEAFLAGTPKGKAATAVATESEAASVEAAPVEEAPAAAAKPAKKAAKKAAPADEVDTDEAVAEQPVKKATAKKATAKKAAKKAAPAEEDAK